MIDWSAAEPGVEDTVCADTNGPRPPTNYPQTYKSWNYKLGNPALPGN